MADDITVKSEEQRAVNARAARLGRARKKLTSPYSPLFGGPRAPLWDKSHFRAFQNSLTPQRRAKDEQALQKAFELAAEVPVFRQALEWARANKIEFFIDRKCDRYVGAYYCPRQGVVGMNQRALKSPMLTAVYLVHEIRHAWQDAHGLLGQSLAMDFAKDSIRTATVEADATAFETLAMHQAARAQLRKQEKEKGGLPRDLAVRLKRMERLCDNEQADLWRSFRSWFDTTRPYFYGTGVAKREASIYGMGGEKPVDHKYEYKSLQPLTGQEKRIDLTDAAQRHTLGKTFSGGNYLNGQKQREFLLRTVDVPSLARQFWRAGAKAQPLAVALRKKEMLIKSDEPTVHVTAFGLTAELAALSTFLKRQVEGMEKFKDVSIGLGTGGSLSLTARFKRGADPLYTFSTIARELDGRWTVVAPSVKQLFVEGHSKAFKPMKGRLERKPWAPASV